MLKPVPFLAYGYVITIYFVIVVITDVPAVLSSPLLSRPILLELLREDLTCQFSCSMKASKRLAAGKLHLS